MVGNHLREEILTSCKATAMIYNDSQKKWLHCAANGPAKVQLLFAAESQTYRIVGRQIQDHEVVLNHSISKGIKYNQATATFHQWRDQSSVYGLNFSSKIDAQEFGTTMLKILESVNGSATLLVNGGATLPPASTNTPSYKRQSSQPPVSTVDDEETNYALISDSCQFYGESKPSAIPPAPPLNLPTSNGPPPPPPPPPPVAPPPTRKSLAPQMDLMSEMAAKFAQRRKLLDDNDKPETINVKNVTKIGPTPLTNTSPCVTRKVNETNGSTTSIDWDKFKGELLADIRKEIDKAKQEILSALLDQHTKI